jgi:hypothetical protein
MLSLLPPVVFLEWKGMLILDLNQKPLYSLDPADIEQIKLTNENMTPEPSSQNGTKEL